MQARTRTHKYSLLNDHGKAFLPEDKLAGFTANDDIEIKYQVCKKFKWPVYNVIGVVVVAKLNEV